MLKRNISPKNPEIEVSNDTFAERKCCEVFAHESETFHRRRSYGISHCENGEQKPKAPFPLHDVDPHLIQQCLGPPHAPPQTATPTVEALSHTDAVKSPLVTMTCPKFSSKVPLRVNRSLNPTICLIPGPVRPMMSIRRFSAMHWTDHQTDRQIVHGKV